MHTNVKYEGTDQEKRVKALKDLKEWFGGLRFADIDKAARAEVASGVMTRNRLRLAMSFGGIEGYPVEVYADELGLPPQEPEDDGDIDNDSTGG